MAEVPRQRDGVRAEDRVSVMSDYSSQDGEELDLEEAWSTVGSSGGSISPWESGPSPTTSYSASDEANSADGGPEGQGESHRERLHLRNMTAFPFPEVECSASACRERFGLESKEFLGQKSKIYYAESTLAPEYLDLRVEMRRLPQQPNLETFSGTTRLVSPSPASSREVLGPEHSDSTERRNRYARKDGARGHLNAAETQNRPQPGQVEASENTTRVEQGPSNRENDSGAPRPQEEDEWRPGDDVIPPTDPDYQAIPNFTPPFDPNEETTFSTIRQLGSRTLPRLKRKCKSLFGLASLRNHYATSPRLSAVNNRAHRRRWALHVKPTLRDVSDIIERRKGLTGRRLMVGSTEIRIFPSIPRKKLLYYLMDVGDGLQVTINDLGKWSVDTYPEYKDDLSIMRWLIDSRSCRKWSFTVDNLFCCECVSTWRMKRGTTRIKERLRKKTQCTRIPCPHTTKIKKFFVALGDKHTSRMRNIKLLVSAENCLNPEMLTSAIHTLTTTFPVLQKVEVEFQQEVGLLPERILRSRRRRSLVRSLRHLEKWIAAEERLKVTGLDAHPRLVSAWNDAKRSWYYDSDFIVRFLRESERSGTVNLDGRARSL